MTDTAAGSLKSLTVFCTSFENQLKTVGDSLNSSTQKTLNGLAGTLDGLGNGLDQTDVLKNAKDTIKTVIDDKWDEYTTKDTTILNINMDAKPVSLTSDKNPSPASIQVILRTEEISEEDVNTNAVDIEPAAQNVGLWQRIVNVFVKIWDTVTGFFKK